MRRGFCRIAFTALMLAGGLSGCVQMTRHSNTMVFGTNTSFGITVGQDAAATPSLKVGYARQEAVVMPLLANTGSEGDLMLPCPHTLADDAVPAAEVSTSCRFVGIDGDNVLDSYSVLASFGVDFSADAAGRGKAGGKIAQYFATGLAARILAENGGAALVAAGEAATANADAMARLSPNKEAIKGARERIAIKIAAGPDHRALLAKIDEALGTSVFSDLCPPAIDASACAEKIRKAGTLGFLPREWNAGAAAIGT
jgi:hypothetical protein